MLVRSTLAASRGNAAGTGMVIGSNGIVLTNHHVVAGAATVKVTLASTGRTYTARVLGSDATYDVAVLKLVGARGLTTVAVSSDSGADQKLAGLIQLDADVVPGDSGGVVLDGDGQVVGMTTAASTGSGNISGYAIPIARALRIAGQIEAGKASGTVTIGYHGFLGVQLADTSTRVAGIETGTAAASLGITAGDTITSVDGTTVSTAAGLAKAVGAHDPGARLSVSWTDAAGTTHHAVAMLTQAPVS